MERAVELALSNVNGDGQPFGAVFVEDDCVVAAAVDDADRGKEIITKS
ncbi:hypothetical protein [Bacillus dakarensis]|nr:hypothetical protein [Bacillus dakarensis]